MQLRGCEFITEEEKKTLRVGEKYIREREQHGECNTFLLELAATEVVKCVQYNANEYRSIRGIAIHGWASDSAKIKNCKSDVMLQERD